MFPRTVQAGGKQLDGSETELPKMQWAMNSLRQVLHNSSFGISKVSWARTKEKSDVDKCGYTRGTQLAGNLRIHLQRSREGK